MLFSDRYNLNPGAPITIRNDFPKEHRGFILVAIKKAAAHSNIDSIYEGAYNLIDKHVLLTTSIPQPFKEGKRGIDFYGYYVTNYEMLFKVILVHIEWKYVYDFIEILCNNNVKSRYIGGLWADKGIDIPHFIKIMNRFFVEKGFGWELTNDGKLIARDSSVNHAIYNATIEELEKNGLSTATNEFREAVMAISRRPEPNITGAITHAMAGLECTARELTGNPKATLGALTKNELSKWELPSIVLEISSKLWGLASERGRHLKEGQNPDIDEAFLVMGAASTICHFLLRRHNKLSSNNA